MELIGSKRGAADESTSSASAVASAYADPVLLLLLGLGLLVRAVVAWQLDPQLVLRGDEHQYVQKGLLLANEGVLDTGDFVRPPLYFMLLAGLSWLTEPLGLKLTLVVRLLQCVAGTAAAIPVYRTTTRLIGRRGGLIAAGFLLFDPTLIAYCHLIWPETLFLLAVALVFDGVVGIEKKPAWRIAAFGTVTGLALLLKPAFGIFTLLLAGQWLWRLGWRETLRLCLILGGVAAVVISPWVVHNQLRYGPSILLENQGPYNLWIGNDPAPPKSILREWQKMPDPVTRSRVARERGMAAIEEDPARFAELSLVRAMNFWGLEFFVVRHATIGGYGRVTQREMLRLFYVIEFGAAICLLAAALGLRRAWRDPTLGLLLVHAAVFTLIVSAMVTTTRFRVPFAFLLSVSAGMGVDALLSRRFKARDLVPAACALLVLGLSASRPVFRTIAAGDFQRASQLQHPEWRFFRY